MESYNTRINSEIVTNILKQMPLKQVNEKRFYKYFRDIYYPHAVNKGVFLSDIPFECLSTEIKPVFILQAYIAYMKRVDKYGWEA